MAAIDQLHQPHPVQLGGYAKLRLEVLLCAYDEQLSVHLLAPKIVLVLFETHEFQKFEDLCVCVCVQFML